jgi:alpha-ketoglutarate-dependent taurine dioxygenase
MEEHTMTEFTVEHFGPGFGSTIEGFEMAMLDDESTAMELQVLFDERGLLLFRDVDLTLPQQIQLCKLLIRGTDAIPDDPRASYFVSNRRPQASAPFGRLQFHMDTAWANEPNKIVSLYGTEIEPPVAPTSFASTAHGYATLPADLRARIEGKEAIHSAGRIRRRGDVSDVLFSPVERPPWTRKPMVLAHPRTGVPLLYVGEQNTSEIVDMDPDEGEALLDKLFEHLYAPENRWDHHWRERDLAARDNLAVQHARSNVPADAPARTQRNFATPNPALDKDQLPSYTSAP